MTPACPLCGENDAASLLEDKVRYYTCGCCTLIFAHPDDRIPLLDEVLHYQTHDNRDEDLAYRAFLSRLADPVCAVTPEGSRGIDIGCGPTPVMGSILTERGRPTLSYDPLFRADDSVLAGPYDFATCSEVVEHAHDPDKLLRQLASLVRPGGTVGIMTRFYTEAPFATWWYRRDPTHICFYAASTMEWIASRHGWRLMLPADNVALFTT